MVTNGSSFFGKIQPEKLNGGQKTVAHPT